MAENFQQEAEQALEADRQARNRGDIPWEDTIDQLTEAEHRAFEAHYAAQELSPLGADAQVPPDFTALQARVDDLVHGTEERQHQREQDQGMGY